MDALTAVTRSVVDRRGFSCFAAIKFLHRTCERDDRLRDSDSGSVTSQIFRMQECSEINITMQEFRKCCSNSKIYDEKIVLLK